ncbi:MAG: hypothetical protein NC905_07295 [Candidatus Omnitrophica bacterium]|nr:hypothetical protein [Candidatus Omnitrophota bacterium]
MIPNMETIKKDTAIKILYKKRVKFLTISDAGRVFNTENINTIYKLLQRLEKSQVLKRVEKGKYIFSFRETDDFELANFMLNPSYISLESALSFYGILPQFPYTITSVTPLKTKKIIYENKEFEFIHMNKKYFFSFIKKDNFLIATPEKALLDELYLVAKKLRNIHFEDLDLKQIDKRKLRGLVDKYYFLPLHKLIEKLKIC